MVKGIQAMVTKNDRVSRYLEARRYIARYRRHRHAAVVATIASVAMILSVTLSPAMGIRLGLLSLLVYTLFSVVERLTDDLR